MAEILSLFLKFVARTKVQPFLCFLQKILEKVVKMDPLFVNARVDLGRFYISLGDNQKAEEHFLESLKMTPGNVDANRHYASLLENQVFTHLLETAITCL